MVIEESIVNGTKVITYIHLLICMHVIFNILHNSLNHLSNAFFHKIHFIR